MKDKYSPENMFIDQTISQRTGFGPNEMVAGWQSMLEGLLAQMRKFLQPGRIITFRNLTEEEQKVFHQVIEQITLKPDVCGVYLSHHARNQMFYTNRGLNIPDTARIATDRGVLLFNNAADHHTIVNGLLALPPHTPAIDVYSRGALLAGYVYGSVDDLLSAAGEVVATHLGA